jgi:predicted metal-dependent HD superfamily phosphohydrolase
VQQSRAVDCDTVEWVAGTIEATADHLIALPDTGMTPEAWEARAWMLDLDLAPLGEPADAFAMNSWPLRQKHAQLTDAAWEEGRLAFLKRLASAPRLFRSPLLALAFETQARAKITEALRRHM